MQPCPKFAVLQDAGLDTLRDGIVKSFDHIGNPMRVPCRNLFNLQKFVGVQIANIKHTDFVVSQGDDITRFFFRFNVGRIHPQ